MKNFKLITLITGIFLLLGFTSCIFNFNGIKGNGNIVKETRSIDDFSKIEISGAYKIYLTQGSSNSLMVEGDENLMQYITTENKGDELVIDSKENLNPTHKSIKIYLTFTNLNSINLSGACEVHNEGILVFDNLFLEGSGASEFVLNMNANKVDFDLSGASELILSGKAKEMKIDGSGAVKIKAYDFVVDVCKVDLSGAAHATLNVSQSLSINISGASSISYKGNAKIVRQSTSGASSIKSVK